MIRWLAAAAAYALAVEIGARLGADDPGSVVGLWLPAALGVLMLGIDRRDGGFALALGALLAMLLPTWLTDTALQAARVVGVAVSLVAIVVADRFLARAAWQQPATDAVAVVSPVLTLAAVALAGGASHATLLLATADLPGGELGAVSLASALSILVGLLLGAATIESIGRKSPRGNGWLRSGLALGALAACVAIAQVAVGAWAPALMLLAWLAVSADLLTVVLASALLLLGASSSSMQGWLPWIGIACVGLISLARFDGRRQRVREEMQSLVDARTEALHAELARRRALETLQRDCPQYDPLTGVPNRALLRDRMCTALADARRNHSGLAVCYFNLDGMDAFNAAAGRGQGDRVLAQLALRLQTRLRGSDTMARVGGDEFAVLAPRTPSEQAAAEVALRILTAFDTPLLDQPRDAGLDASSAQVEVGVSLGVALYPQHGDDPETLMRCAEDAMREVKRRGKGGWMLYAGQGVVGAPSELADESFATATAAVASSSL